MSRCIAYRSSRFHSRQSGHAFERVSPAEYVLHSQDVLVEVELRCPTAFVF